MPEAPESVRRDLVDALSQSPLLQFVKQNKEMNAGLRTMLETAEVVEFKRGTDIIHEGQRDGRMFFITSGKVEVRRKGQSICTLARRGDVFGEIGAIAGELRSATVKSLTDVTCLATNGQLLERLTNEGKLVFVNLLNQALTKLLMGRLNQTNDELAKSHAALENARKEIATLKDLNSRPDTEDRQTKTARQDDGAQGEWHKKP